jgi:DNA-directed RNA polymerase subunit RPC12/RpoP
MSQTQYPCSNCGASVEYAPGTTMLECPYCGAKTPLQPTGVRVREHAYAEFAELPRKPIATLAAHVFQCRGCGAVTESDKLSDRCQFCDAPLVADAIEGDMVTPEAVLPFQLDRAHMREALRKWASSRWFAPNSLKRVTEAESSRSTYLPHWTYDAETTSAYRGERGDHYWETETYTENGETKTRQVQRTAWHPVHGVVDRAFDDVLVPWPRLDAEAYRPEYLAGHETLRYDVEPEQGLSRAKETMRSVINDDCRRDIGGDEQRVHSVDTQYRAVMFKLMLLPVWVAVYLHAGKTYNVLVNGRTGEVAGERPYSALKIALAIVLAVVVIAAVIALLILHNHGAHR